MDRRPDPSAARPRSRGTVQATQTFAVVLEAFTDDPIVPGVDAD